MRWEMMRTFISRSDSCDRSRLHKICWRLVPAVLHLTDRVQMAAAVMVLFTSARARKARVLLETTSLVSQCMIASEMFETLTQP
jgi:hypothetical protein